MAIGCRRSAAEKTLRDEYVRTIEPARALTAEALTRQRQLSDLVNAAYGLSPAQIAKLPPAQRTRVDEIARKVGTYFIGRAITQGALIAALRAIGLRVGAQQAAKLAPAVGLAASAALSGWMFMRLCERHIGQCEQVRDELLALPGPGLVIDV